MIQYCVHCTQYCRLPDSQMFAYLVYESHFSVFCCSFPWLLDPPIQGPSCSRITTYTHRQCNNTDLDFIARSSCQVCWFSSHVQGCRPFLAHWNKRKTSQYGGDWNDIQAVCLFTELIDDCWLRLTVIRRGWGKKPIKDMEYAQYTQKNMQNNTQNLTKICWIQLEYAQYAMEICPIGLQVELGLNQLCHVLISCLISESPNTVTNPRISGLKHLSRRTDHPSKPINRSFSLSVLSGILWYIAHVVHIAGYLKCSICNPCVLFYALIYISDILVWILHIFFTYWFTYRKYCSIFSLILFIIYIFLHMI